MSYNDFDPRTENYNLGKMWCWHRRYNLGDESSDKLHTEDYSGWSEIRNEIVKQHNPIAILPLYLYDHSGITMKTSPFSCPWDSGQVGFIFMTRDKLSDLGYKIASKGAVKQAIAILEAEVRDYDRYLCGDSEESEEDNG